MQPLAPRQRGREFGQAVVAEVQLHEAFAAREVAGYLGEDVPREVEALQSLSHAGKS